MGISCALLITAGITGGLARAQNNEYQDGDTRLDRQQKLRVSGRDLETASWTTMGVGLAAAAATVTLFVLSRPRPERRLAGISVVPMEGGGALLMGGQF